MNRLGILGGTFDPIHVGHLRMAEVVREKMRLEKIIFVPSNLPPHKSASSLTSSENRFQMVRLAIERNPFFEISSFEIKRPGKSYTIDTVKYFFSIYPTSKIFFIIGFDALSTLHKWKSIEEVLKIVEFVVVNRPGDFKEKKNIKHHSVSMPGIDISSSNIRQLMKTKKSIRYLIPEPVREYMEQNNLYKP